MRKGAKGEDWFLRLLSLFAANLVRKNPRDQRGTPVGSAEGAKRGLFRNQNRQAVLI
jgi:hypothetical protein